METVCVKIGGSTIDTPGMLDEFAGSVAGIRRRCFPVVVHGGGKDIGRQLGLLGKEYTFVEGMRVTDRETVGHVQMVLSGDVNKRIVNALLSSGVDAVGVSGVDLDLFVAEKLTIGGQDIGFVGTITKVNTRLVELLRENGIVPVVSPVSRGARGEIYNVNADFAAAELAVATKADHLVFVSNVPGVMVDGTVAREIRTGSVEKLIKEGHVTGGMVPKLRSAADAVSRGIGRIHICGWHGPSTLEQELSVETARGSVIY